MVISAGMTMPTWLAVRSLYSLQDAMMLTPCGPSAVPIGGAGLALPAGICSFTTALTRFAMLVTTPQYQLVADAMNRVPTLQVKFSLPARNPAPPAFLARRTTPEP